MKIKSKKRKGKKEKYWLIQKQEMIKEKEKEEKYWLREENNQCWAISSGVCLLVVSCICLSNPFVCLLLILALLCKNSEEEASSAPNAETWIKRETPACRLALAIAAGIYINKDKKTKYNHKPQKKKKKEKKRKEKKRKEKKRKEKEKKRKTTNKQTNKVTNKQASNKQTNIKQTNKKKYKIK